MKNKVENLVKHQMSKKLSKYIPAIAKKFGKYMDDGRLQELKNIKDYKDVIKFDYSGNVTAYAGRDGIVLPMGAIVAFDKIKDLPNAGTNKNHKTYTKETLIQNDNTFEDYIEHLIITKADILTYFNDLLLHETMHFCGSGGSSTRGAGAFREGLNEYLTRLVAGENGFQTSGCGYPKEIKVVTKMEKVLGTDALFQVAFLRDLKEINEYLTNEVGVEKAKLFNEVVHNMEQEFQSKYFSKQSEYTGFAGAIKKSENYKNIDYSKVYSLIDNFDCDEPING